MSRCVKRGDLSQAGSSGCGGSRLRSQSENAVSSTEWQLVVKPAGRLERRETPP